MRSTVANARSMRNTVVASMHIWALNERGLKKVAGIIDQSKPELTDNPRPKEPNGQISYPEIKWARGEVDKLARGEPSIFSDKIPPAEVESFVRDFAELEAFFRAPMQNIDMVRRPALLVGKKTYEDVFELDNKCDLERDLGTMLRAGYDVIGVRDVKRKKTYIALNHHGRMRRVSRGTEGVLKTPYFDQVKVVAAEDINNGFWEGVSLIPRSMLNLVSNVFSQGRNRIVEKDVDNDAVDQPIRDVASYVTPATVALPKEGASVPGLVLATAIGLGAVNLSGVVAAAPEAALVIGGAAAAGTIYNGVFGRVFRHQDPYFIMNFAGIQLADKDQIS